MTVPSGEGALEATQQQVLAQLQAGGAGTPTGAAGTPNTNVVSVQGIAGGTPITEANSSTIVTNTTGLATQTTLSAAKTDLDTIVTQTATPNVSDRWARQVGQVDVARVNGTSLSQSNPVITENNILNWIRNGQGFVASPTQQTSGGTLTIGYSIWNASNSGKTVVIYSLRIGLQTSNYSSMYLTTANPALSNTLTPSNSKPGSGISSVATVTWQNTATSSSGTFFEQIITPGSAITEMLSASEEIDLPPGNGLLLLVPTASSNWTVVGKWVEF